jgi:hypothetical protein
LPGTTIRASGDTQCAQAQPLADTCTADNPPGFIRCGPQRIDVGALIARYGGQMGDFAGTFCLVTDG